MVFRPTELDGVFEICIEPRCDERGLFARTWCRAEFAQHGLNAELVQCNVSFNPRRDTLRGMHFQEEPYAEAKLIRCTMGEIYDVVLDLRQVSKTYMHWIAVVLNAESRNMVYVPEGCAHGFLTLQDNTEVFYQMSQFYRPEAARGVRWNDPAFAIEWPGPIEIISERDQAYPDFRPAQVAQ